MSKTLKRKMGERGERKASAYLKRKGYKIIARNFTVGHRELDIIAENDEYIVFVEVKTHNNKRKDDTLFGRPANAVNADKKHNTLLAVKGYLRARPTGKQPRIDVIEVWLGFFKSEINHIENAIWN